MCHNQGDSFLKLDLKIWASEIPLLSKNRTVLETLIEGYVPPEDSAFKSVKLDIKPLRLIDADLVSEIQKEINDSVDQPRISVLLLGTGYLLFKGQDKLVPCGDYLGELLRLNGEQTILNHGLFVVGAFPLPHYEPTSEQFSLEKHDKLRWQFNHWFSLAIDVRQHQQLKPNLWGCHFEHPCRWYCLPSDELAENAFEEEGMSLRPGAVKHMLECILGYSEILADRMKRANALIKSLGENSG